MSDAQASRVGSMFGPYHLKRLLGRGGMGEVYEAEHTVKEWTVAVKLMSDTFSKDPVFRERMKREARIAGRLQEPHVVPIHDYGEIDGQMFMEMRLIEGIDLDTLLKRFGPLTPPRAVAIITQIASALDAAHAAGVMHRDVKPPNILVTRDDFAYLVDFGIASATTDEKLTQLGTAVGTWKYMAPERFSNDEVTYRADIYALACVLHECLTGSPPYRADSAGTLVTAHLMDPIPQAQRAAPGHPQGLRRGDRARHGQETRGPLRQRRRSGPGRPRGAQRPRSGPRRQHRAPQPGSHPARPPSPNRGQPPADPGRHPHDPAPAAGHHPATGTGSGFARALPRGLGTQFRPDATSRPDPPPLGPGQRPHARRRANPGRRTTQPAAATGPARHPHNSPARHPGTSPAPKPKRNPWPIIAAVAVVLVVVVGGVGIWLVTRPPPPPPPPDPIPPDRLSALLLNSPDVNSIMGSSTMTARQAHHVDGHLLGDAVVAGLPGSAVHQPGPGVRGHRLHRGERTGVLRTGGQLRPLGQPSRGGISVRRQSQGVPADRGGQVEKLRRQDGDRDQQEQDV